METVTKDQDRLEKEVEVREQEAETAEPDEDSGSEELDINDRDYLTQEEADMLVENGYDAEAIMMDVAREALKKISGKKEKSEDVFITEEDAETFGGAFKLLKGKGKADVHKMITEQNRYISQIKQELSKYQANSKVVDISGENTEDFSDLMDLDPAEQQKAISRIVEKRVMEIMKNPPKSAEEQAQEHRRLTLELVGQNIPNDMDAGQVFDNWLEENQPYLTDELVAQYSKNPDLFAKHVRDYAYVLRDKKQAMKKKQLINNGKKIAEDLKYAEKYSQRAEYNPVPRKIESVTGNPKMDRAISKVIERNTRSS